MQHMAGGSLMSNQVDGGWSNRKKFTMGGALTALASIVTIVSFFTSHNNSSPTPTPGPSFSSSSTSVTPPAPGTTVGYRGSVRGAYLSNCEQNVSGPSFCQCTLSWLEAHVSQSQFTLDMAGLNQFEQGQASDPPPDVAKAYIACSTNGG